MAPEINLEDPFVQDVFAYLDALRDSGETNMFGAGMYLTNRYGFDSPTSHNFVSKWMEIVSERHAEDIERHSDG